MAKEHPRYEGTEWGGWEFQEFPMMVYPGAPDPKKPYDKHGKPLPGVIVQNVEEAAAVMPKPEAEEAPAGAEALAPVAEAPAPVAEVPAAPVATVETSPGVSRLETDEDVKVRLLAEAERLGVTVDKRWGVGRLQDAIDSADAAVV